MSKKIVELRVPVNRVEGDLDIEVRIEEGVITEARSIGTLYRGFENILKGRDPMDALVITPRVCGICSISHLQAAVKAIEDAYGVTPPPQAVRFRNLSILCENLQSDLKQIFLMFLPDFASSRFAGYDFYEEAKRLYEPFRGELAKEILDMTRTIVKVIAYIGGQWPHTSHMVPGGLSVVGEDLEVLRIRLLIVQFKEWLHRRIYGIAPEAIEELDSFTTLEGYVRDHPDSEPARFLRIAREVGLMEMGRSGSGFLSYGSFDIPEGGTEIPAGFFDGERAWPLDREKIVEDLTFAKYEGEIEPPAEGTTRPLYDKEGAYSLTKAPRYDDRVVQTGPLAEELVAGSPLFLDLYRRFGDSVFVREIARMLRPARYIRQMEESIEAIIRHRKESLYEKPRIRRRAEGVGMTHAARGALGHWLRIREGKIDNYQIISPTTWNGSPRDAKGRPGPWEKALEGVAIADVEDPVEMGWVIRSFDPCLVCTVHFIGDRDESIRLQV